jgi:hypothetical protein
MIRRSRGESNRKSRQRFVTWLRPSDQQRPYDRNGPHFGRQPDRSESNGALLTAAAMPDVGLSAAT